MTGRILCRYPAEPGDYSSFSNKGGFNLNASSCYCVQLHENLSSRQPRQKMTVGAPKHLFTGTASTILLKSGKYEVALNFSENL